MEMLKILREREPHKQQQQQHRGFQKKPSVQHSAHFARFLNFWFFFALETQMCVCVCAYISRRFTAISVMYNLHGNTLFFHFIMKF